MAWRILSQDESRAGRGPMEGPWLRSGPSEQWTERTTKLLRKTTQPARPIQLQSLAKAHSRRKVSTGMSRRLDRRKTAMYRRDKAPKRAVTRTSKVLLTVEKTASGVP